MVRGLLALDAEWQTLNPSLGPLPVYTVAAKIIFETKSQGIMSIIIVLLHRMKCRSPIVNAKVIPPAAESVSVHP